VSPEPEGAVGSISREELQLATRNHGMPLEALRWPVTPAGLHYLLVHYDIPAIDPAVWSLTVGGRVRRPLDLTLDELRDRPSTATTVTMECAGNGRALLVPRSSSQPWIAEAVGTATWGGVPLRAVLDEAGLLDDAVEIVFSGLDRGIEGGIEQGYERSLPVGDPSLDDAVLAYEMNGAPLLPQHGFPLRLVVPGWYGMTNVKWLDAIVARAEPFDGYQQSTSYRLRQRDGEEGTPLTRMLPRALMVPPGVPDFLSRRRHVPIGSCAIEGRAWSGGAPLTQVLVSTDGGETWHDADLGDADLGPFAWRGWSWDWDVAEPGTHELCCRAVDDAGNEQPLDAEWNLGGYANNAVQRVTVEVHAGPLDDR
jgi:DMSO/TMAO reductase YedYZ molybdopterin-dependent catalytic subunit